MSLVVQFAELTPEKWAKKEINNDLIIITVRAYYSPRMKKGITGEKAQGVNSTLKINAVEIITITRNSYDRYGQRYGTANYSETIRISGGSFVVFSMDQAEKPTNVSITFSTSLASTQFYTQMLEPPSYSALYNSDFLSDITFVEKLQANMDPDFELSVENLSISDKQRKLNAHRVLLSSNSAFFKEMFSSDMQESNESEISLWCRFDVFEVILRFMRTQAIDCDLFDTSDFNFWAKVFEESKLIGIPSLQKLALWFAYCLAGPKEIFGLLDMCREQKDCGFILQALLKYIGDNWDAI